jgi:long-chain fatty acid transport protein
MRPIDLKSVILLAGITISISSAQAAGYMVQETNGLFAQAYAGRAAAVEDASTMFVNPAVLGYQCKHQIIVHNTFIIPYAKLSPRLATQTAVPPGAFVPVTTPMVGNNGGNGGQFAYVPAFYAIANAFQYVKFGIGITSPFGLSTKYDGSSVLRYTAIKSHLTVVNINPAVAFRRCFPCWGTLALGVGFSFQRVEADLEKKVDVDMRTAGGTRTDVLAKVRGTNNAPGFNLGAIYEPCAGTRFGLAYRSMIIHRVKGFANFLNLPNFGPFVNLVPALTEFAAGFNNVPAYATLKTPDIVNFSAVQEFKNCWSVLADVMFTRWTVLRQLQIVNNQTGQIIANEVQSWRNTWMVSLGANYRPTENLRLRTGIAFDQTPTRKKTRTARIPDNHRYWLTGGVDYNWCDQVILKLSYAHLFLKKAKIDNTVPFNVTPGGLAISPTTPFLPGSHVAGKFKAHIDLIGVQFLIKI